MKSIKFSNYQIDEVQEELDREIARRKRLKKDTIQAEEYILSRREAVKFFKAVPGEYILMDPAFNNTFHIGDNVNSMSVSLPKGALLSITQGGDDGMDGEPSSGPHIVIVFGDTFFGGLGMRFHCFDLNWDDITDSVRSGFLDFRRPLKYSDEIRIPEAKSKSKKKKKCKGCKQEKEVCNCSETETGGD